MKVSQELIDALDCSRQDLSRSAWRLRGDVARSLDAEMTAEEHPALRLARAVLAYDGAIQEAAKERGTTEPGCWSASGVLAVRLDALYAGMMELALGIVDGG